MGRKRRSMNQIKSMPDDQKVNPLFVKYYKEQGIVPEDEWESFIDHLKSDLIATFRVTGFREQSSALLRLIQSNFVDRLQDASGDDVPKPTPLSWYPGEMAWSLNATRQSIRRSAELKKLHTFLVSETETGYISRQEAVSMIPPLLLDVRSHHAVLDLCAAPGSKTAQLVELLHSDGRLDFSSFNTEVPSGVVVANDRDNDRCYMMIHQVKRLQSPCVVVMRQDATIFPRLYLAPQTDENEPPSEMLFDRVLTDVPCSGDGTLRKNPDLWTRWNPGLGVAEHFIQARIVKRGLEVLKVGGRLVYSTCSLNPVEDEAVICSILKQCGDSVRLVDVSDKLPGLKSVPGVKKWKVMTKEGEWVNSAAEVPAKHLRSLRPSLFPPTDDEPMPPLERCRRILPHHQNTGGFFIAVLEKVDKLPWMNMKRHVGAKSETGNKMEETCPETEVKEEGDSSPQPSSPTSEQAPPAKKSRRTKMIYKEDPFYYMERGDADWAKVLQFYGVQEDAWPTEQLLFRCAEGKRRNFYFTNGLLRRIVKGNGNRENVNFINLGVKMFAICEDNGFGGYRLIQEGLELYEPLVTRRRIHVTMRRDLMILLRYEIPLMYRFSDHVRKQFDDLEIGPVVIDYVRSEEPQSEELEPELNLGDASAPTIRLTFTGWRGKVSLRLYVNKHERDHLMRLCGVLHPPVALEDRGLKDGDTFGGKVEAVTDTVTEPSAAEVKTEASTPGAEVKTETSTPGAELETSTNGCE